RTGFRSRCPEDEGGLFKRDELRTSGTCDCPDAVYLSLEIRGLHDSRAQREPDGGSRGAQSDSHRGTCFLDPIGRRSHLSLNLREARVKLGRVRANSRDQVRNSHLVTPSRKVFSAVRAPLVVLRESWAYVASWTFCRATSRQISAALGFRLRS